MLKGLKTAALGMEALAKAQDVIANNIANINTAGFKKDIAVFKSFNEVLEDSKKKLPYAPPGCAIDEITIDTAQGSLQKTDNPYDFAITGKGFFSVETPDGTRYTRAGSFAPNGKGELVTPEGYPLLGKAGIVTVPDGKIVAITKDGKIMIDGNEANQIIITSFSEGTKMEKTGSNMLKVTDGEEVGSTGEMQPGYLEMSTVNAVEEMVAMIETMRSFETAQKAIHLEDTILDKAVNSVGRL